MSKVILVFQAELDLQAHREQLVELRGKGYTRAEEYTERRIQELTKYISDNS